MPAAKPTPFEKLSGRRVKIFFDGGCRPNPGQIEAAVVALGQTYWYDTLGQGTNRDAEWLALIAAVKLAQSLGIPRPELIGDALAVIEEANRALQPAPPRPLTGHAATFAALLQSQPHPRIRWTKRQQNLAGIALNARHPR